jgi:flagellar biosynthesis/type III secretory pathway ATPase
VYTQLPRLVERPGTSSNGSITALYTVLTTTEDDIDPLADELKSLLDGHIVLSKEMANLGIMPAIDITQSISRLSGRLTDPRPLGQARAIQRAVARYIRERDIALLGGSPDMELQSILRNQELIRQILSQDTRESSSLEETEHALSRLCSTIAPSYVGEVSL